MKKVAILSILIITGATAGLYYYWHQATNLPDWYTRQKATTQPSVSLQPALAVQEIIEQTKVAQKADNTVEVKLSEADINNLIVAKLAGGKGEKEVPQFLKGINTTIKDGTLETGAVVNISDLESAPMGATEKATLDKLTTNLPFIKNQEIYVALRGKPSLEEGKLKLDENTEIKIGHLTFPLIELGDRLGIPKSQIEEQMNVQLSLGNLKIEDLQIIDNNALITGSSIN